MSRRRNRDRTLESEQARADALSRFDPAKIRRLPPGPRPDASKPIRQNRAHQGTTRRAKKGARS